MNGGVSGYLQRALGGEELLRERMHEQCRAAVLFPVYREPVRRVLELLESIADQQEVGENELEVLCVVNNHEDDGSDAYMRAALANRLVLELPVWRNGGGFGSVFPEDARERASRIRERVRAFVIDKTSMGRELAGGTVGRARNRVLAESVHRFARAGKNGVLLMTDSDAVFSDPRYIRKILERFDGEDRLIAGAGGIDLVFDPDAAAEAERSRAHSRFTDFLLGRRWECLTDFLLGRAADMAPPDACFGANIICRSEAAAMAGGFRPLSRYEDSHFFRALARHAAATGFTAAAMPDLRVQTAIRESSRTASSLGSQIADAKRLGLRRHPLTGKNIRPTESLLRELMHEAAQMPEGRAFLRRLEHLPQILYKNAFPA